MQLVAATTMSMAVNTRSSGRVSTRALDNMHTHSVANMYLEKRQDTPTKDSIIKKIEDLEASKTQEQRDKEKAIDDAIEAVKKSGKEDPSLQQKIDEADALVNDEQKKKAQEIDDDIAKLESSQVIQEVQGQNNASSPVRT